MTYAVLAEAELMQRVEFILNPSSERRSMAKRFFLPLYLFNF